jgi:hypothetical protein
VESQLPTREGLGETQFETLETRKHGLRADSRGLGFETGLRSRGFEPSLAVGNLGVLGFGLGSTGQGFDPGLGVEDEGLFEPLVIVTGVFERGRRAWGWVWKLGFGGGFWQTLASVQENPMAQKAVSRLPDGGTRPVNEKER